MRVQSVSNNNYSYKNKPNFKANVVVSGALKKAASKDKDFTNILLKLIDGIKYKYLSLEKNNDFTIVASLVRGGKGQTIALQGRIKFPPSEKVHKAPKVFLNAAEVDDLGMENFNPKVTKAISKVVENVKNTNIYKRVENNISQEKIDARYAKISEACNRYEDAGINI